MLRVIFLGLAYALLVSRAWSAETLAVELTGSHTLADLVLVPSESARATRVWLGPCPAPYDVKRLKVRIGDNRYPDDVLEVRFTDRQRADLVLCTRD